MYVNVQLRLNPATGQEYPYYRLKESYRDVRGNVHSLIALNIGFEPSQTPLQVKRIARSLSWPISTSKGGKKAVARRVLDEAKRNVRKGWKLG